MEYVGLSRVGWIVGRMYDTTRGSREQLHNQFTRGLEGQRQAYSSMFDLNQQAPQTQLQLLNNASVGAQGAMLGGLNNYEAAILGMPTQPIPTQGLGGIRQAQQMFQDVHKPQFLKKPIKNGLKQWRMNNGGQ